MFEPDRKKQAGLTIMKSQGHAMSPDQMRMTADQFHSTYPMRNHKVDSGYNKSKMVDFTAQGDNGGMSHNRFQNKGNDILRRKRQSNMRNIGYGISSSVKPKKLHLTYDDY